MANEVGKQEQALVWAAQTVVEARAGLGQSRSLLWAKRASQAHW